MGRPQNTGSDSPAVIGAVPAKGIILEKAGGQLTGLWSRKEFHCRSAQITVTVEPPSVEQHLTKLRVVGRGGVQPAVTLGRTIARPELGAGRDRFEQAGLLILAIGGNQVGT